MIGLRSTGTGSITSPLSGFTPAQRSLNVFIDTARIGVLSETGNLWRFTYDAVWVQREDSFDICPNLPRSFSSGRRLSKYHCTGRCEAPSTCSIALRGRFGQMSKLPSRWTQAES